MTADDHRGTSSEEEPNRGNGRRPGIDVDKQGRERERHTLAFSRLADRVVVRVRRTRHRQVHVLPVGWRGWWRKVPCPRWTYSRQKTLPKCWATGSKAGWEFRCNRATPQRQFVKGENRRSSAADLSAEFGRRQPTARLRDARVSVAKCCGISRAEMAEFALVVERHAEGKLRVRPENDVKRPNGLGERVEQSLAHRRIHSSRRPQLHVPGAAGAFKNEAGRAGDAIGDAVVGVQRVLVHADM